MYVCMYVCMHACMHACMYACSSYIYIYIWIIDSRHWISSWPEGCCSQGQQALVIERSIGDFKRQTLELLGSEESNMETQPKWWLFEASDIEIDINTY